MNTLKHITIVTFTLLFWNTAFTQSYPILRNNKSVYLNNVHKYPNTGQKNSDSLIMQIANAKDSSSLKNKFSSIRLMEKYSALDFTDFSNLAEIKEKIVKSISKIDNSELRKLKDSLRLTSVNDEANLTRINSKIDTIKATNLMELLTTEKAPKPFWILNSGKYKIDSFNKYLYQQNKLDVFQHSSLQNFSNSNVINSELGSFLAGPLRIGVGGSFTTKADTAKDNAIKKNIQQILSNGGEFNLLLSLPIVYYRSRKDNFHFGVFAQSNFGINPGFDTATKITSFSNSVLFNNQSGFDIHIDCGASDSKGSLYLDFPFYYVWGNNNTYQQLTLPDFGVIKMQAGIQIAGLIDFRISSALLSSSKVVQRMPFIVSIQFSPSQIANSVN